ncbi:MAG: mechanosensitive ion channel family protein, partial [Gammaproteobacteria bacterium]
RLLKMLVTGFDMLWWFVPAFLIIQALERFVWRPVEIKSERPVPALLRGFVGFIVFLFAFLGVVAFVFDEKVTSLLATSGVLAMIIGLAIQLNISHLFSGIAINLERPFRVGDWVKIGDHEEAKVIDMTWRATRLATRNLEVIHLPNTKAAESPIKNYAMPTEVTRLMHRVRVIEDVDPKRVTELLSQACLAVDAVLEDPAPIIFYLGVTDWSSEFDVAFFINDYQRRPAIMTQVWHSIWRVLTEAGIKPAIQRQELLLMREPRLPLPQGNASDGSEPTP